MWITKRYSKNHSATFWVDIKEKTDEELEEIFKRFGPAKMKVTITY